MTDFEEQTAPTDIIDATQSAVIDAVNSVSELIEKQTQTSTFHQAPATHEAFYLSAEFWVGMAFVLAVIMIINPVFKAFKGMLEKRRNKIINTLAEAENLHIEAQQLLADYERQFQNTKQQIEKMAQQAASELNAYAHEKNVFLEQELLKKQNEAENVIQTAIEKVRFQMRDTISKQTMQIVHKYLKQNLNNQKRSELIDASIEHILNEL